MGGYLGSWPVASFWPPLKEDKGTRLSLNGCSWYLRHREGRNSDGRVLGLPVDRKLPAPPFSDPLSSPDLTSTRFPG